MCSWCEATIFEWWPVQRMVNQLHRQFLCWMNWIEFLFVGLNVHWWRQYKHYHFLLFLSKTLIECYFTILNKKNLVIICIWFFLNHRNFFNYLSASWLFLFSRFLSSSTYCKQAWPCHRQILIPINGCQSAHVVIWFVWPLIQRLIQIESFGDVLIGK